jgi:hypothetical protein
MLLYSFSSIHLTDILYCENMARSNSIYINQIINPLSKVFVANSNITKTNMIEHNDKIAKYSSSQIFISLYNTKKYNN